MFKITKWFVYFIYFLQCLQISVSDNGGDSEEYYLMLLGNYHPKNHTITKHIVSLRTIKEKSFGENHFCAGSILNAYTIVTAAHCVVDPNNPKLVADPKGIFVVAGSTHRTTKSDTTKVMGVKKVIKHEKYEAVGLEYDIAVLKLDTSFHEDGTSIQKIPLVIETPRKGTKCIVAGWGRQYEGESAPNEILYATATVVGFDFCKRMYSEFITVKEGMLCTFDARSRVCKGDSGGPLICGGKLAGIVSWGAGCNTKKYANVYTDVNYYSEWLAKNGVRSSWMRTNLLVVIPLFEYYLL